MVESSVMRREKEGRKKGERKEKNHQTKSVIYVVTSCSGGQGGHTICEFSGICTTNVGTPEGRGLHPK